MTMLMFMVKKDRDQSKVRHYKRLENPDWRQRRRTCCGLVRLEGNHRDELSSSKMIDSDFYCQ